MNRDPWATNLQVSMAKKGKVLEQKKMLQPLLGTPEGIHRGCIIVKEQVFVTNRDPWATYLQVSMAKEGKVLEQKKPLEPLLGTPEGIYRGCTISFSTSTALAVYPNGQCVGKYGQQSP